MNGRLSRGTPRRAAAAMWALVVMTVLGVALGLVAVQFVANRRAALHREGEVQADWLARAGLEWAAAGLLADRPGPRQETLALRPGWSVHVTVAANPERPGEFTITSEAHDTSGGPPLVRSLRRDFRRVADAGRVRLEPVGGPSPGPVREILPAPALVRELLPSPTPAD